MKLGNLGHHYKTTTVYSYSKTCNKIDKDVRRATIIGIHNSLVVGDRIITIFLLLPTITYTIFIK